MSEHISEDLALILTALPPDDPERLAALAHTESCAACTRLLERGAALGILIDAQSAPVNVDWRLKARILASIQGLEQERSGTRWEPHALAVGSLLSIAFVLLELRGRAGLFPAPIPWCLMWEVLGAGISLAAVGSWVRAWAWRASPLRLATIAMAGALIAQLCLHMRCSAHDAPLHVLTFHVTGVLLSALLGYLFARATWQSQGPGRRPQR